MSRKTGKKYTAAFQQVELKPYSVEDAVPLVKKVKFAKFDETVELLQLGPTPAVQTPVTVSVLPAVPQLKLAAVTVVLADTPLTAKLNVAVWLINGLCPVFPSIEPFEAVYGPGPMIV